MTHQSVLQPGRSEISDFQALRDFHILPGELFLPAVSGGTGFSAGELVLCTAATAASDSEWKLEAELKLFKDGSYMMFT